MCQAIKSRLTGYDTTFLSFFFRCRNMSSSFLLLDTYEAAKKRFFICRQQRLHAGEAQSRGRVTGDSFSFPRRPAQ